MDLHIVLITNRTLKWTTKHDITFHLLSISFIPRRKNEHFNFHLKIFFQVNMIKKVYQQEPILHIWLKWILISCKIFRGTWMTVVRGFHPLHQLFLPPDTASMLLICATYPWEKVKMSKTSDANFSQSSFPALVMSHSIFCSPLLGCLVVLFPVRFVNSGYFWYKWIVGIWVS